MKIISALVGSRRGGFMPCEHGKSSLLFFYFAKNRDNDFSLLLANSGDRCSWKKPMVTSESFIYT